jgi:hypothetical protein
MNECEQTTTQRNKHESIAKEQNKMHFKVGKEQRKIETWRFDSKPKIKGEIERCQLVAMKNQ